MTTFVPGANTFFVWNHLCRVGQVLPVGVARFESVREGLDKTVLTTFARYASVSDLQIEFVTDAGDEDLANGKIYIGPNRTQANMTLHDVAAFGDPIGPAFYSDIVMWRPDLT